MSAKIPGKKMRELVLEFGGNRRGSENWAAWYARVARDLSKLGRVVEPRMIRSAHHNEITNPDHWLGARIKEALRQRNESATREANELAGKFETIAHAMQQTDPHFYSEDVAALVNAARILSGLDRT